MDELIRRSDAIRAIDELPNAYNGWSDAYDKAYIISTLEEVPSADRLHGEWIKRHGTINCSVCKRSNWSACFEDTVRSFNFCPNCGARMKGADDEV